jgi:hypothetical protein
MKITSSLIEGLRLVNRAPAILACVYALTLLTALPLSLIVRDAISEHLGNSMLAEQAARGVNVQWWSEFIAQTGAVGKTFETTIIGFAAVLDNLSTLADRRMRPLPIIIAGAAYIVLWLFLSGGILDRYARGRPTRVYEFFAACGTYFLRFLRLAPIIGGTHFALFASVHPLLLDYIYRDVTRNVTQERSAFFIRLALYGVFAAVVASFNVLFDYAKVRAVVEDRRSMLGALVASWRFIRRHAGAVAGLYILNTGLFVGVLLLYALVAPGPETTGARMWLGIVVTQVYVAARIWVKLVFLASETALFQGRLAHAGYVATAPSTRPEPPIVERLVQ